MNLPFQLGGYHAPYSVEGAYPDGGAGVLCWAYSLADAHRQAVFYRLKGYKNVEVKPVTPEMADGWPIAPS